MFCWLVNVWDIWWIGLKVKIIEQKLMKSIKFDCLDLMKKWYDWLALGH